MFGQENSLIFLLSYLVVKQLIYTNFKDGPVIIDFGLLGALHVKAYETLRQVS